MDEWIFYICCYLAFFGTGVSTVPAECEYHVSPTLPTSIQVEAEFNRSGIVSQDGTYMTCHPDYVQCMVLWSFDQSNPNITTVLFKGCWKGNGDCERESCIAHDDINSRYLNNSRFCCCSSHRCNSNFTFVWMPKTYTKFPGFIIPRKEASNNYSTVIIIAVIGFVVMLLLIFGAVFVLRSMSRKRERLIKEKMANASNDYSTDREHLLKGPGSISPQPQLLLDADQIDLLEVISRGRFCVVWKSVYKANGERVAVKIYSPAYRQYFYNENQIYTWTHSEHDNIVRFYGGAEKSPSPDDQNKQMAVNPSSVHTQHHPPFPQYWIVTAYMPQGTLQDFLKANTVDWEEMCKMGASVACGLAYLHGGGSKPPIVHRDIKSRNVLVKPDGTCALCDFGFAMALEEPKAGSQDPSSDTQLNEVGTLRYFAPEILEGAVNLRDPATALKQVDIYALGLVLWEIVSRCAPIYRLSDHAVPEYEPPFAKEIVGPDPTLEQMQLWVCKKKIRPLFPQAFYKINIGALRVLRILIEDCWDTDSEARITASCAHERLVSLHSLASVFGGAKDGEIVLNPKPFGSNEFSSPYSRYLSYPELGRQLQFIGGDSTVDTGATSGVGSMCLNSSDRGRSINSSLGHSLYSHSSLGYHTIAADSPATLQPYQGRNPCMERNLHVESSDDSAHAKNRISESQFQKIDPCSPDTFARFASPALIALATRDSTGKVGECRLDHTNGQPQSMEMTTSNSPLITTTNRLSAAEKGNALAFLLMKSEKNKKAREDSIRQQGQCESQQNGTGPSNEQQQQRVGECDFRGSVTASSNDSGNCTTSGGSGTNSANGSPKLRPDHIVPV